MGATQQGLTDRMEERATKAVAPASGGTKTIDDLLKQAMPAIEKVIPKHLTADRLMQVVTTAIKTTPRLKECSAFSLLAAVMQSAQLGLFPGPLGHCYYVPFKNTKKGVMEVQFIAGYRGLIDLARRSGSVASIEAREVCENDQFDFNYGLETKVNHTFDLKKPRGAAYAYYGVARYKDGGYSVLVMSRSDVDKHRLRSAAVRAGISGPWDTDYDEMAKKTVIRAMSKYMPMSVDYANALAADETVKAKYDLNTGEITDEPFQDIEAEYTDKGPEPTAAGGAGNG